MDALVMCGGRGTRLDAPVEKPLVRVAGEPMIRRVRDALDASRVDSIYAVTSPATQETTATVDCLTIEAPGEGYVPDLQHALEDGRVSLPVLTVAADLPALDGATVDAVLDAADGGLTVAVPVGRKRALGLSVETAFRRGGTQVTPAGINVVADDESVWVSRNWRLAVNVNRGWDRRVAEWRLARTDV